MNIKNSNQKNNDYKLIDLYLNNELDKFKKLIDDGANINFVDFHHKSLISIVIENRFNITRNKEFFDVLIDAGVSLSQIGLEKGLLSLAIVQNEIYYAEKLLKNGINVNQRGICNISNHSVHKRTFPPAIFDAVYFGKQQSVDLLLKYNADLQICDSDNIPLYWKTILNMPK